MPISVAAHNAMLDTFAAGSDFAGLIQATQLAADVLAGATTVDLDHAVDVGDKLSFNDGTREVREATAVSGAGPFTVTLDVALDSPHGANTYVGVAPKAETANLREAVGASYARQAISWGAASAESVAASTAPSFDIDGGQAIGGFLVAAEGAGLDGSGAYQGAVLTSTIEVFGSAGTYQLTQAEATLTD